MFKKEVKKKDFPHEGIKWWKNIGLSYLNMILIICVPLSCKSHQLWESACHEELLDLKRSTYERCQWTCFIKVSEFIKFSLGPVRYWRLAFVSLSLSTCLHALASTKEDYRTERCQTSSDFGFDLCVALHCHLLTFAAIAAICNSIQRFIDYCDTHQLTFISYARIFLKQFLTI